MLFSGQSRHFGWGSKDKSKGCTVERLNWVAINLMESNHIVYKLVNLFKLKHSCLISKVFRSGPTDLNSFTCPNNTTSGGNLDRIELKQILEKQVSRAWIGFS